MEQFESILAKCESRAPLYATVCQSVGVWGANVTPLEAVIRTVEQLGCISGNCHWSLFQDALSDR